MNYEIYIPGQQVLEAQQALDKHKGHSPGDYVNPWEDALNSVLGQIQDRGPFHYDPAKDPLYRQAVDRYVGLGRQAMMDTLGKTTALTGGYANSYAQTAGQQTYQKYLLALSGRIPQFQQMALQQYEAGGKNLMDRFAVFSQQEKTGHDRYQQAVARYYGELHRLQDALDRQKDRDYNIFVSNRDFEYGKQQDAAEAARQEEQARQDQIRFELQQAYQKERDKIKDQQWQQDFEEGRRRHDAEMALRQAEAAARAAASARRGSSSGSRGSRGTSQKGSSGPHGRFSRDEYYRWRSSAVRTGSIRRPSGNTRNMWY